MTLPNSYTLLTAQQKIFYDRVLLERLLANITYLKFGQKKTIPKNEGAAINFRRFSSLPQSITPLTEGVTPAGRNLTIIPVNATVQQFGDFVTITDLLELAGIDPVLTEVMEALGEQAGESLDIVVRNVIGAGTNVFFVGGGPARINVGAAHVVTGNTIRRVRQIMARNNVKPVSEAGAYIAFIHPDQSHDLTASADWLNPNTYADPKNIFEHELGKLHGVRFIETTLAPIYTSQGTAGRDVYGMIVIGANAYGIPDIAGKSKPEYIIMPRGSGGTQDPLKQRSTCGWVAFMTAVRLDELCILRVESCVSSVA